jgi:hypothetical protein
MNTMPLVATAVLALAGGAAATAGKAAVSGNAPASGSAAVTAGQGTGSLRPLAFLAGHCFRGELANGKDVDEHCFQWLYGGRALRDTHMVRGAGHADYAGETTYYWDSLAKRIEYLYIENQGGIMRGAVESADGALVFPATSFVADGTALTIRARWTLLADGSYEAWSEMQDGHAWKTMFRLKMARSS